MRPMAKCDECNGEVYYDQLHDEHVCVACGLTQERPPLIFDDPKYDRIPANDSYKYEPKIKPYKHGCPYHDPADYSTIEPQLEIWLQPVIPPQRYYLRALKIMQPRYSVLIDCSACINCRFVCRNIKYITDAIPGLRALIALRNENHPLNSKFYGETYLKQL